MEKTIKLTSQALGEAVYFNPKHIFYFAEIESGVDVRGDETLIEVKAPWDEVRKLGDELGFLEFTKAYSVKRVLINASTIMEWHEQDDGVLIEFGNDRETVQGTLEEVTAKLEKALEGCAS